MGKSKSMYLFVTFVLLSMGGIIQTISVGEGKIVSKILLIPLVMSYLFLLADNIKTRFYFQTLKKVFQYKSYTDSFAISFFYSVSPMITIVLFAFGMLIGVSDGDGNGIVAVTTINIMNMTLLIPAFTMKYQLVFLNDENLLIYERIIPLCSIQVHEVSGVGSGLGSAKRELKLTLDTGEVIKCNLDVEKLNEFTVKIQREVTN